MMLPSTSDLSTDTKAPFAHGAAARSHYDQFCITWGAWNGRRFDNTLAREY
jgi:hypothetical protein